MNNDLLSDGHYLNEILPSNGLMVISSRHQFIHSCYLWGYYTDLPWWRTTTNIYSSTVLSYLYFIWQLWLWATLIKISWDDKTNINKLIKLVLYNLLDLGLHDVKKQHVIRDSCHVSHFNEFVYSFTKRMTSPLNFFDGFIEIIYVNRS